MDFNHHLPPDARIWIYASDRRLDKAEVDAITKKGQVFASSWTAHQQALKAFFWIEKSCFLILAVDNQYHQASGCSIDKSVHFMQEIEREFDIQLFNRIQVEVEVNGNIEILSKSIIKEKLIVGELKADTNTFDKTIQTWADYNSRFRIPLSQSWVYPKQMA
jgi:hypothetical protein